MIDIKLLRENRDLVAASNNNRGAEIDLASILTLDEKKRDLIFALDQIKKERNENSALIGKGDLSGAEKEKLIQKTRELGDKIKEGNLQLKVLSDEINTQMLVIPNLLDSSVPIGVNEDENVENRRWMEPTKLNFPPLHHADIGEKLDILDAQRGVKMAHSRFTLVKREGARMERALINFMLDLHTIEHGYQEMLPPFLVNQKSMTATGQLPKFEDDLFKTTTGMYLIPTSEVPLTNIYAGEILKEEQLPQYLTAFTPCFRSEAGSHGKDTKGYIRQHQFNKVELVKLTHPDNSFEELEKLVANAEEVLKRLELPYRVISLCSGDIGFGAAKCYDLEVWIPSEDRYREISSCSNCTDFQARRANIRFKPQDGGKNRFVHTLNGSGLAVGRTLVAILENYQQPNGSVIIPDALVPHMGGLTRIELS